MTGTEAGITQQASLGDAAQAPASRPALTRCRRPENAPRSTRSDRGARGARAEDRWHAAQALGPDRQAGDPALVRALQPRRPYVRRHAAEVLGRIGGDQATAALIARLTTPAAWCASAWPRRWLRWAGPRPPMRCRSCWSRIPPPACGPSPPRRWASSAASRRWCRWLLASPRRNPGVRWSVAPALGSHQSRRAVRPLIAAAAGRGRRACAARRRCSGPPGQSPRAGAPGRGHARHGPQRALARGGRPEQPEGSAGGADLLRGAGGREPGVRWRAASALGRTGQGIPRGGRRPDGPLRGRRRQRARLRRPGAGQAGDASRAAGPARAAGGYARRLSFLGKVARRRLGRCRTDWSGVGRADAQ